MRSTGLTGSINLADKAGTLGHDAAELSFELYVTTTYDDLLVRALKSYRDDCEPIELSCQWDPPNRTWIAKGGENYRSEPSLLRPIVFHLHGTFSDPNSLVLTETNHMNLTAKLHRQVVGGQDIVDDGDDQRPTGSGPLLPPKVRDLLSPSSWLFVGYGAADRNLRGVIYALNNQVGRRKKQAVAVQLQKGDALGGRRDEADEFLTEYFSRLLDTNVEVVIGDAGPFLVAVREGVNRTERELAGVQE